MNQPNTIDHAPSLSLDPMPRWLRDLELFLDRSRPADVASASSAAQGMLIVGFAMSPEVALLPIRSVRAAHLAEFFLGTLTRLGCSLESLAPEAAFHALVFSFSHDYIRRFRRRAQRLEAGEVLSTALALFDFADRHLGYPNAAANRAACDFAEARTLLSTAMADGRLGRTFAGGLSCEPANLNS